MTDHSSPETRRVADADPDNWVDKYAPYTLKPYFKLARFDRPIGAWLLLFPCWWSQALAELSVGIPFPNIWSLVLFAVGAFVMRGAGCAWNDYLDRDIDARVARTRNRPIPSGQISPFQAVLFAILLSLIGLVVLVQFNTFTVLLAISSLILVALYPLAKRFIQWPQIILGLTFKWGALVGWASVTGGLAVAPIIFYLGCVLWTIGYDTIYAHQDKDDDRTLGLNSTALNLTGDHRIWIGSFYVGAVALWTLGGLLAGAGVTLIVAMIIASAQLAWQVTTLNMSDRTSCLVRFRSNRLIGWIIFAGLAAEIIVASL